MRSRGTNRLALAASFLALGLSALVWWGYHYSWYRQRLLSGQRGQIAAELAPYGNVLSGAINRRLGILKGLKAFVERHLSDPSFAQEFERFAAGLYAATTEVRFLTVAPGGIPRHVYPLSGNESVIGHDPMRDPRPAVRADVERAIESREITLSEPYELHPGGLGLVGRLAVHKGQTFWGFVTIALDLEGLLKSSGLMPGPARLKLALRSASGQVFFGDRTVFDLEPVIYRVELAKEFWELAATPHEGWNASIHQSLAVFNGAALIILLLLSALVYLGVSRHAQLNRLVEERTGEIERAKEQLERELAERKRIEEELREAHDKMEVQVQARTNELAKANQDLALENANRRGVEEELRLLLTVGEAIRGAINFQSALGTTIRTICEGMRWDYGEAWIPQSDKTALERSPEWCGCTEAGEKFRRLSDGVSIPRGLGLVGKVWASREPLWIDDVSSLSFNSFPRAKVAIEAGIRAALGVPVVAGDQVLAVLVFCMTECDGQDKQRVETVEAVAAQLGALFLHKTAEEALRESEFKFHGIFNQTFQFVGLLKPDGTLLEANQAALDFIGCKLSDVVGRPFWETPWWSVSPEVQNQLRKAIAEATKGNFVRYETEHRRSDGFVATFDFSLKPVFDETGQVVLIIPEGRDITAHKQAQEELRRAREELEIRVQERTRELARTNEELHAEIVERQSLQERLIENSRLAAIGTTAAKIAHEIANPLNGMSLTVQRLERQLARQAGGLDEAVQISLRRLMDEIRRLSGLLYDFRSLSRRDQYNFQLTALTAIAAEILAMEAENYAGKGVRVEQRLPADLPLVQADRDKLKQALWNLCKNAVEAMPQGGTLTVNAYSSGADVILEVADTGVGVPPGVDIFEPFTTTKSSGSGLGLVVVRQIVAAHGGNITYTRGPGKGTTFRLVLPQAALQHQLAAP